MRQREQRIPTGISCIRLRDENVSLNLDRNLGGSVSPKERALRGAIIAAPIFALPITPSAIFGIQAALVVFCLLAGIPAIFVALFYALWLFSGCTEGFGRYGAELIGDDSIGIPPIYWPFGSKQRAIRHRRRVRALEIACQIPTRDYWYADA